ncbi:MAG: hypothetical protein RLY58_1296 [Pseudomonadota bacterium]|jgi:hypothetical protein
MSFINSRPLVATVTGQEKMPTGEVGDLTISPAQIVEYAQDQFSCGDWVVQTLTPNPLTATTGCVISDGILTVVDRPALEGDASGYVAVAKGSIIAFPLTVQVDLPTIVGNYFMIGITESGIDIRDQLAQLQTDGMAQDSLLYVGNAGGGFYQTIIMTDGATGTIDPMAISSGVLKMTISSDYVLSIDGHGETYPILASSAQALSLASYGETRDDVGDLAFLAGTADEDASAPLGAKDGFVYRVAGSGIFSGKQLSVGSYVIFINGLSNVIVIDQKQDVIAQVLAVTEALAASHAAETASRTMADTVERNARTAADTAEKNDRMSADQALTDALIDTQVSAYLLAANVFLVGDSPRYRPFGDGVYLMAQDVSDASDNNPNGLFEKNGFYVVIGSYVSEKFSLEKFNVVRSNAEAFYGSYGAFLVGGVVVPKESVSFFHDHVYTSVYAAGYGVFPSVIEDRGIYNMSAASDLMLPNYHAACGGWKSAIIYSDTSKEIQIAIEGISQSNIKLLGAGMVTASITNYAVVNLQITANEHVHVQYLRQVVCDTDTSQIYENQYFYIKCERFS